MPFRSANRLVTVAALWLLAAGIASAQGSTPTRVEAEVLAVHHAMTKAAEALDIDGLFSHMLETSLGSIVQNGVVTPTRQQALEDTRKRFQGVATLAYRWDRELVSMVSPDVAVLTASGTSSITTTTGSSFTAPFAQTVVFVRRDGQWKALHAHQSSPR